MAAVEGVRIGGDDGPVRKKPRISELPISSAKRSSVEGLLHIFKKKGEFDSLRKKIYAQFESGDSKANLLKALQTFTDDEIDKDPIKYLGKDRRLAAPLLEGAAARANIYPTTEVEISDYISKYLEQAETALREVRNKEIGEDAAREERKKGAKSDEAYAAEAEVRRQGRARKHAEELRIKKKKEAELAKKRQLEALQARAAELSKETERLQREQKRRAEREAARAKQKQMEEERRKQFAEERDRREKEQAETAKRLEEEREKRQKEREAAEAKRLEEEALARLIREGGKMAEKPSSRGDYDRDWQQRAPVAESPGHLHQSAFVAVLGLVALHEGRTTSARSELVVPVASHTALTAEKVKRIDIVVAVRHGDVAMIPEVHHVDEADRDHRHDAHIATGIIPHPGAGQGPDQEVRLTLIDMYLAEVLGERNVEMIAAMIAVIVTVNGTATGTATATETGTGTGVGIEETETETETETTTATGDVQEIRPTADVAPGTALDHAADDERR
ncbi:complex proteins associated with Set1p component shg1-domain-containing protein [Elsinoe ampelina]|uniref:Complex proteins associated with Set1p component shg1-domain-containing protein n=1 Tax=Elsinoe ampelina TaxID=302913 RepID=A0A6A6GJI5_9PEZI|nr:complex proteins associated with Set1p component shg1-domain-containing protein [Elsinoe ampelina]